MIAWAGDSHILMSLHVLPYRHALRALMDHVTLALVVWYGSCLIIG
jgi:hypothetical protein